MEDKKFRDVEIAALRKTCRSKDCYISTDHNSLHHIMKRAFLLFLFPVFVIGVFGESVSVKEGDSVTLHTDATEIKTDEEVEWRFNSTRIARVTGNKAIYDNDVKFKDRLQLDIQTGDLKISNFRITDSGLYKFEINSPRVSSEKTFRVSGVRDSGVKSLSVLVGDSVSLHSGVSEIQRDGVIRWRFEHLNTPVAEISRKVGIFNTSDGPDGRFRDRLQLEYLTGSLTIKNIGTSHSGVYEVEIRSDSRGYTTHKSFNVTVSDAVKTVSVIEGESVTLPTNVTEIQTDDLIQWMFGDTVLAEIHKTAQRFSIYDGPDGRFRDRLKLDHQTGSLIINNTRITDSGVYEVKIISSRHIINRRFTVIVSGLSPAAVAGIVVAVVAVVILVTAAVIPVVIKHRRRIAELERQKSKSVTCFYSNADIKAEVSKLSSGAPVS
ncbi:carcinoembryonic antigen-related cell adhesion molecule 1-like [Carassius auratus]|uniref:Carcinoembryonic antigen-related cell adhesion molecule 1-like n=1 Tax=Carassius auratus TaxID=7957 RepID=A0A6P6J3S0_CARAU|nr:carcinoembryonic antigen-related cell adhesion molecule 1-like [Carassius auratus]